MNRWDATVSLLSRRPRIIPPEYFDALSDHSTQNDWTFFDLVGCPSFLVHTLVELIDLAAEYESTKGKRWTKFDHTRVSEIEDSLRNWNEIQSPPLTAATSDDDEATMHHKQDIYHCAEAWKSALLLYVVRIFQPRSSPQSTRRLSLLSRVTLDHVRSCRRTSRVQKQLLLPVYLAACETSDGEARQFSRDYCAWWNDKSAYGMFSSAGSLMESLWTRKEDLNSQEMWWGQIIDEQLSTSAHSSPSIQCLLG